MTAIKNCYSDVPEANFLEHVFDVKTWLSAHILPLHNHSYPHIFRFVTGQSGEVVMYYKMWSESSWEPVQNGVKLFKVIYVVDYVVCGLPQLGNHEFSL